MISPSSAIFTSTPSIGCPTVPNFTCSSLLFVITGLVSVKPYPSRIIIFAAAKNSAISWDRGAPPETKNLNRPPTRSFIFENTSFSASPNLNPNHPSGRLFLQIYGIDSLPTPIAHQNIF